MQEYNILIDAILNSQKGILQPHIIPAQIVRQMKANQDDIPSELALPFHSAQPIRIWVYI